MSTEYEFPVYTKNDFLPYADDSKSYWTGFYTSRPNFKETVREASRTFQAANHHLTLAALNPESLINNQVYKQKKMTEAIAMSQHHEVITGTMTKMVRDDFLDYLYKGLDESDTAYGNALNEVLNSRVSF